MYASFSIDTHSKIFQKFNFLLVIYSVIFIKEFNYFMVIIVIVHIEQSIKKNARIII